jgi:protein-L-isoaspartate(D-aspartate) O-methyltransferase
MSFLNFFHRQDDGGSPYQDRPDEQKLDALREEMVEYQIKKRGVEDERVLDAIRSVPRHEFTPELPPASAYEDRPLPIGEDQTISQPYIVAVMTEALNVEPGHRVLEIGTGSGYQAAVLAEIADRVFTIERLESLQEKARGTLTSLGYDNISFRTGDGTLGWEEHAPYDRIIVTAGAPEIPEPLVDQLRDDGGILVIPAGSGLQQELIRVRMQDGTPQRENLGACAFVKLIGEEGWSY